MPRLFLSIAVFTLGIVGPLPAAEPVKPPLFNADVRPLFKAYCTECHGEAAKPKGGLDLRLQRFTLKGGETGPAVIAGKPHESLLISRVKSGEMPPGKKKLNTAEIALLTRWIEAGAKVETKEPESLSTGFVITEEDRRWWAFQQIRRPDVPKVANAAKRIANPVDAFLLKKLDERGLAYASPTDRVTLIRRVYFDLIGLPPSPVEVEAFVKDKSPDAYGKLIDKLLSMPQYGERWGHHWLDVAGYADSEGGSPEDPVRTNAWKYRDYVIRAFNSDMPFDRFIREQLAGDELVKPPYAELPPAELDALVATGFLRMAPDGTGVPGVDQTLARNAVLTDTVKITSSAFLGMTVGCAQCHNHRYDPIAQTDFFRLRAAFEPGYDPTNWKAPAARQVSLYKESDKKAAAAVEAEAAKIDKERLKKQAEFIEATFTKELAKLPKERQAEAKAARETPVAKRSAAQKKLMQENPSLNVSAGSLYLYDAKAAAELKKMSDSAAEVRNKKPVEEFVRVLTETPGKLPVTHLHHRGDPEQPKEAVTPGGLSVLDKSLPLQLPGKPTASGTSGRRLALANWLTDPRHPLTARVLVNRIWMLHFGHGIVNTPGDFGRLGELPTHPELLDWLASEFVNSGWRVKAMHRMILMSSAYQQSSRRDPRAEMVDPDNKLLSHFPLRRLDAESVRDAMLAVSGKLNSKAFGPPVPVMEDDAGLIIIGKANRDGAMYKLGDESVPAGDELRRSVYIQMRRSKPLGILGVFDNATSEPNCEMRTVSTSTPQSLILLNGEFVTAQAAFFADRIDDEKDRETQVKTAWKLAYLREPTKSEMADALQFLSTMTETFRKQPAVPDSKPVSTSRVKVASKTATPKPAKPAETTPEKQALTAFCQALLCSNRFLYVD